MSISSDLGKRKYNIYSKLPPLKQRKIGSSSINFISSLICIDSSFFNCCNNITLCISYDRNIFSIGNSDCNSHGHKNKNIFPFKQIQDLTHIKMIDCGNYHSICLNYYGDVYSFGRNDCKQLGIGKDNTKLEQTYIPQKIHLPPCKQVSCGNYFTICLTEDNTLYSFGNNTYGQLGLGNNNKSFHSPQLIPDFNNIEYIVCGGNHSICKTFYNEYYSWGDNTLGQLGQGTFISCNKPIQCLNWPDNIIDIKCGSSHSLLLTSEGQVYSFGSNNYGSLGINDKNIKAINILILLKYIPEIQRIECGNYHSICIDINNNLWIFGYNYYGQLGLGDRENRYKPILHPILSNILDISSGGCHTFIKTIDNKIYTFGYNSHSQLGIQTKEEFIVTPIQVFQDNEDIWSSTIHKSKQKSARK